MTTTVNSDWVEEDYLPSVGHPIAWLTKPKVLTRALVQAYNLPVSVEVLNQSFDLLQEDERVGGDHRGMLREVFLVVDQVPRVYARVTVANPHPELISQLVLLGDRPLGKTLLYNNAEIVRSAFTYRHYACFALGESRKHIDFHRVSLWARRSVFAWREARVTVSEFFSPTIKEYPLSQEISFRSA